MEKDDDLVYNKNDNVKKKNSKESRQELETPENEKEENFEIEGSESEDQVRDEIFLNRSKAAKLLFPNAVFPLN